MLTSNAGTAVTNQHYPRFVRQQPRWLNSGCESGSLPGCCRHLSDWTGIYTSTYDSVGRLNSFVDTVGVARRCSRRAGSTGHDETAHRHIHLRLRRSRSNRHAHESRVQVTSWSYDAASRVARQALANGVVVSNVYDNADRQLILANLGTAVPHFPASRTATTQ